MFLKVGYAHIPLFCISKLNLNSQKLLVSVVVHGGASEGHDGIKLKHPFETLFLIEKYWNKTTQK